MKQHAIFLRQMRARVMTMVNTNTQRETTCVSQVARSSGEVIKKTAAAALTLALLPTAAIAAPNNGIFFDQGSKGYLFVKEA